MHGLTTIIIFYVQNKSKISKISSVGSNISKPFILGNKNQYEFSSKYIKVGGFWKLDNL